MRGYLVRDCPETCTWEGPLWSINISGTGEAEFSGSDLGNGMIEFSTVSYTLGGLASPTPELAGLFLSAQECSVFAGAVCEMRLRKSWRN